MPALQGRGGGRQEDRGGGEGLLLPQCCSSAEADPSDGAWRECEGGLEESSVDIVDWTWACGEYQYYQMWVTWTRATKIFLHLSSADRRDSAGVSGWHTFRSIQGHECIAYMWVAWSLLPSGCLLLATCVSPTACLLACVRACVLACSAPLHCATLRYTALHCATLRYTTLHYATLRYTTLHHATLRYTILHDTKYYTTVHSNPLRFKAIPC